MKSAVRLTWAPVIAALAAALMAYTALFFYFQRHPAGGALTSLSDLSVLCWAGRIELSSDRTHVYDFKVQQAYDVEMERELAPGQHFARHAFIFPPFVLLILAPLALLSYAHAVVAWYVLNVVMLIAIPFLLRGVLHLSDQALALALVMTPMFLPVLSQLGQGQVSVLLLLVFALTYRNLVTGADMWAGCVLAIGSIKPQYVVPLLLVLVVVRRWEALKGFAAGSVALFVISVGLVGWRATLQYPEALLEFSHLPPALGGEVPQAMFNLRGFLTNTLGARLSFEQLHGLTLLISAVLLLAMLVPFFVRGREISALEFSLVITTTMLASYHAYIHDMSLLLLPFLLVASYIAHRDLTPLRLTIALSGAVLFIIPSLYPAALPLCIFVFGVGLWVEGLRFYTSAAVGTQLTMKSELATEGR